jgi:hypothetical protein
MMYRKLFVPVFCVLFFCFACASGEPAPETGTPEGEDASLEEEAETVEDIRFILEEQGLSITLPGDLAVVTRTETRNRFILDRAGLETQGVRRFMRDSRCYLYSLDTTLQQEIMLTVYPQNSRNYGNLTDEELEALAGSPEMAQTLANLGTRSSIYSIYRSGSAAWFIIDIRQEGAARTMYAAEYYTVVDDKAITIALQSAGEPLTAEQFALLKAAVDGVTFR